MPTLHRPSCDILRAAVDAVLAEHQKALGRRPTKEEWEALLTQAVDRQEVGVVISVKIDLADDDELDEDDDL
jgi:hypothetical protein